MSERPESSNQEAHGRVLTGLGDRVRRLRVSRGLDQRQLAARVGIDEEHLAGVESGGASPSLEALARVAGALDVALAELFTESKPGPAAVVQRGDEVPTVDAGGMSSQVLTPRAVVPGLYAARYRISPSSDGVRPVQHEGHDWLYVLSGELHVEFEQDSATLRAGDSISFSSRVPHRLSAVGEGAAEFLAVGVTPSDAREDSTSEAPSGAARPDHLRPLR